MSVAPPNPDNEYGGSATLFDVGGFEDGQEGWTTGAQQSLHSLCTPSVEDLTAELICSLVSHIP